MSSNNLGGNMLSNQLTMQSPDIKVEIASYIKTQILFDEKQVIGPEQSLLGSGILDSTGILELVSYIEEHYGLKFLDEELIGENFDTIARIAAIVQKKTS